MRSMPANLIYKVLSLIMAVTMIFGCLPMFAAAEDGVNIATSGGTSGDATPGNTLSDEDSPKYIVTGFAELSRDVKNQSVPFGTPLKNLALPKSLRATVSDGEIKSETNIKIDKWRSDPDYDSVTIGTYEFTPELPKGFSLAKGAEPCVITVTVKWPLIAPFSTLPSATQASVEDLATNVAGSGVTPTNIKKILGDASQFGTFEAPAGMLPFDSGIVLSTGTVGSIFGSVSASFSGVGYDDLKDISGYPTYDAAVFEFDVVPDSNMLSFQYFFASSEYDQGEVFNDVFALWIIPEGGAPVNIALLENGKAVSIQSTVARNASGGMAYTMEGPYYRPITGQQIKGYPFCFLGHTITLNANGSGLFTEGKKVTIRMAIADSSDNSVDSAVFIKADSVRFEPPSLDDVEFDEIRMRNTAEDNILTDLDLISIGKEFSSDITWASDKPDVISDKGVVIRPMAGEPDEVVTLTATISNGGVSKTQTFVLTVKAIEVPDVTVESIEVIEQPRLEYMSGDGIDLKKLVVRINYSDGTAEDVPFDDFSNYYLATDFEDGDILKDTDNGKPVTVTYKGDASVAAAKTKPLKVEVPNTGDATGTVTEDENPIKGVIIEVMSFGTEGKLEHNRYVETNDEGVYFFENLPYGTYSLVARRPSSSIVITKLITIDGPLVTKDIRLPPGNQYTIVDVRGTDTPSVAVDNLEEMFTDEDFASSGVTVTMRFVVERVETPPDKDLIEQNLAGNKVAMYLDAKLLKTVRGTGGIEFDGPIQPPNGTTLTTVISLPSWLSRDTEYKIIRSHDDKAEFIPAKHVYTLHTLWFEADKFSTYAIVYGDNDPPSPEPQPEPAPEPVPEPASAPASNGGRVEPKRETSYWIEPPEATSMMAKHSREQGLDYARSRRSTITGIREESLHILGKAGLRYQHDVIVGNTVQIRVSVNDPVKATKDILVSGYLHSSTVDWVKAKFEKLTSSKVAVISMEQQGDFGITVQIAAKVDLSGMDVNNLYFYSFDKKKNKYTPILTEYKIDKNGYLHFLTELAGDIIVSDVPFDKQVEMQLEEQLQGDQNPGTGGDGNDSKDGMSNNNSSGSNNRSNSSDGNTSGSSVKENLFNPSMGGEWDQLSADPIANIEIKRKLSSHARIDSVSGSPLLAALIMILAFAVIVLWALIPRKGDELISIEDYRSKRLR